MTQRIFQFIFFLFLPFVAYCVPTTVWAQQTSTDQTLPEEKPLFGLDASISSEGIYDTNIFQTQFNAVDDFYATLQPRVSLHLGYRVLNLDLAYQPRFIFFTNHFGNNNFKEIQQDLNFRSTLFTSQYFDLVVRDTLNNTKTFFSGPATPNNLSLQNRAQVSGIFTYEFGPLTTTQISADVERRDIQFPGEDYLRYGGSATLTRELTDAIALFGKETASITRYDDASIGNSFLLTSEAGVKIDFFERLTGRLVGTYDYLFLPGPNDQGKIGYAVELNAQATETTVITLSMKQHYGQDLTGHPVQDTRFEAILNQQLGPRTLFTAKGYYDIYKIPTFGIPKDQVWGTQAGFQYEITEKWRAGLRYEMDRNIGPVHFNDFTAHRGILELTYDFGKLFNVY